MKYLYLLLNNWISVLQQDYFCQVRKSLLLILTIHLQYRCITRQLPGSPVKVLFLSSASKLLSALLQRLSRVIIRDAIDLKVGRKFLKKRNIQLFNPFRLQCFTLISKQQYFIGQKGFAIYIFMVQLQLIIFFYIYIISQI